MNGFGKGFVSIIDPVIKFIGDLNINWEFIGELTAIAVLGIIVGSILAVMGALLK